MTGNEMVERNAVPDGFTLTQALCKDTTRTHTRMHARTHRQQLGPSLPGQCLRTQGTFS